MYAIPQHKVVRSVCYFTRQLHTDVFARLDEACRRLVHQGYTVQTRRICLAETMIEGTGAFPPQASIVLSVGTLDRERVRTQLDRFMSAHHLSFTLDITPGVELTDIELFFEIVRRAPQNTFNFGYVANNRVSSPFFPSANYGKDGFAIGLQMTDLAEACSGLEAWLQTMKAVWTELAVLFMDQPDFLGIDSSVAPMFRGKSSLVHFMKRLCGSFSRSVTTDTYLTLTHFLQVENPKPVGLCGVMFPCLEDFELAEEYEAGNFSIERNLFLALHCGLGIDTYPIGVDESPARVLEVLSLLQGLSAKYGKPLLARFVSDGQARIGERTDFRNPYLQNVVVRKL
jgi:hypothetical protein